VSVLEQVLQLRLAHWGTQSPFEDRYPVIQVWQELMLLEEQVWQNWTLHWKQVFELGVEENRGYSQVEQVLAEEQTVQGGAQAVQVFAVELK